MPRKTAKAVVGQHHWVDWSEYRRCCENDTRSWCLEKLRIWPQRSMTMRYYDVDDDDDEANNKQLYVQIITSILYASCSACSNYNLSLLSWTIIADVLLSSWCMRLMTWEAFQLPRPSLGSSQPNRLHPWYTAPGWRRTASDDSGHCKTHYTASTATSATLGFCVWPWSIWYDREPDRLTRSIREVIHIRKEGAQAMNRNEGCYQLSHAHDSFLGTTSSCRVKNRKN